MRLLVLALAVTAVPLSSQTLVVLNKGDATMQLIEASTGKTLATLPTGPGPHEVAVSPDGKLAVAADYGGRTTLTVVDIPGRKVLRTVPFGVRQQPHGIRFLADNKTVVVTAERDGVIVTVDVVAGVVVGEKKTGQTMGHMVAMSPDEKIAYVANITPGTLSIIDYVGNSEPSVVKVGTQTEAINLSPDGKTVWMGSNNTGKVFVIDPVAKKVIDSIQTKGFPYRIAFTPDSKTALITNPDADEIQVVDMATRKITMSAPLDPGSGPFGIVVTPQGKTAWVTMARANKVAEFDIATGKVLRSWNTGQVPDGLGLTTK